jgi:hypothetical protein
VEDDGRGFAGFQGLGPCGFDLDADGWKFAERVYEVGYLGTTRLEGSAPRSRARVSRSPPARGRRKPILDWRETRSITLAA